MARVPILPGGDLCSGCGGFVSIARLGTSLPTRLDVAQWRLAKTYMARKCNHSGTFGGAARRRTSIDWRVELSIWWDGRNQVEPLTEWGGSCELLLHIGDAVTWALMGYTEQPRWYAPSGLLTLLDETNNAEGEDIYRSNAIFEANSHIFLLPNDLLGLQTYQAYLTSRGEAAGSMNRNP